MKVDMDEQTPLETLGRMVDDLQGERLEGRVGTLFWLALQEVAAFEPLGVGGSRIVVGVGDGLVAKVDADPDGTTNWEEHAIWEEYAGELPLAPVVGMMAEGRILLMQRAHPVFVKKVPKKYQRKLENAKAMMADAFPGMEDWKWDFNWGVIDGQVVCIDYAS